MDSSTLSRRWTRDEAKELLRAIAAQHPDLDALHSNAGSGAATGGGDGASAAIAGMAVPQPASVTAPVTNSTVVKSPPPPLRPQQQAPAARGDAPTSLSLPPRVQALLVEGAVPPSARGFSLARYRVRHVALHVAYLGHSYWGFASQSAGGGDLPDVEEDGDDGDCGDGGGGDGGRELGATMAAGSAGTVSNAADAALNNKPPSKRPRPQSEPGTPVAGGASATSSSTQQQHPQPVRDPLLDPPTIESLVFAALRKACLIEDREGCGYTRCGRTDRGVSAGGQVMALRIRSKAKRYDVAGAGGGSVEGSCSSALEDTGAFPRPGSAPGDGAGAVAADCGGGAAASTGAGATDDGESPVPESQPKHFHRVWRRGDGLPNTGEAFPQPAHEVDYCATLNSILPPDIRVLGWADVPERFSARFSASTRTYRYYFPRRDLNLGAMRSAGRVLCGVHDFRNVCKIDLEHTQNFVREIISVRVVHADHHTGVDGGDGGGYGGASVAGAVGCTSAVPMPSSTASSSAAAPSPAGLLHQLATPAKLNAVAISDEQLDALPGLSDPRSMCYIEVVGRAFLWHQIRCVAALLFLVGRGAESPATVAALLDVASCPSRPQYPMASESPLILHHCGFGEETMSIEHEGSDMAIDEPASASAEAGAAGSALSSSSSSEAAPEERRVRFLRSHPPLHLSWNHSVTSLKRVTLDLERQWTALSVKAAMVKGVIDRLNGIRVREDEVTPTAAGAADGGRFISWGGAVDRSGRRSAVPTTSLSTSTAPQHQQQVYRPLVVPGDAEYEVLPLAPGPAGAGASSVPKGCYLPLLSRATGKGVEQRWRELSQEKRAQIAFMHPTNAPALDKVAMVNNGNPKA